ncbi:MAG: RsmD family RNA methyltransferase [Candidatus Saccharimonadales bacterium]
MRVITGSLGGRQFNSPKSDKTHPMSDKIRGALFNILGDIEGLTVLDVFAGSGALSFEAISRGAAQSTAIDNDRAAQRVIAENIQALGLGGRVKLVSTSASTWLQSMSVEKMEAVQKFDVVLCDPPYDNLQPKLIDDLAATVNQDGILALSWPGDQEAPVLPKLELIDRRQYGDAALVFYRQTG